MKKVLIVLASSAIAMGIIGCTNEEVGTVGGTVAGGLVGNAIGGNTASTIGGAAVGGFVGNRIGRSQDNSY